MCHVIFDTMLYRNRIHERTISLRFPGIILGVLRLQVSVWISVTIGKGVWFSFFLLYSVHSNCTLETVRGRVSLKKYKSQGKAVEMTVNSKETTIKTFVWDPEKPILDSGVNKAPDPGSRSATLVGFGSGSNLVRLSLLRRFWKS